MNCNVFYRISNKSYPKEKLPGATKKRCFENFLWAFGRNIVVIADNCDADLVKYLWSFEPALIVETSLGNSGSFRHALNMACHMAPQDFVYFVEDDYLHLPQAPTLLTEGIEHAHYVTVYDHPDKYGPMYQMGEESKVYKTNLSHWRYTVSTTMTFGARVQTLREDLKEWMSGTENPHPDDHGIFVKLRAKDRCLGVSIPGAACHVDLTYSAALGKDTIEPWATEMMLEDLASGVDPNFLSNLRAATSKLGLLACLQAAREMKEAR